jgi:hypothetical protein
MGRGRLDGLLAPELVAGIARVKGAKSKGVRTGNWLSQRQAQALLASPDISTKRGLRDRAIIGRTGQAPPREALTSLLYVYFTPSVTSPHVVS